MNNFRNLAVWVIIALLLFALISMYLLLAIAFRSYFQPIVIMIAIGVYSSRKTHSVAEFAVAGRSMSLPLCTATIVATWIVNQYDFNTGTRLVISGSIQLK